MQSAYLIFDRENNGRPVPPRRRDIVRRNDQKSCRIMRHILDVTFQHLDIMYLGGFDGRDRGGILFLKGPLNGISS